MPTANRHSDTRLDYIERNDQLLTKEVKALQQQVWKILNDKVLSSIDHQGGRVKSSASNYALLGKFRELERTLRNGPKREIVEWLTEKVIGQLDEVEKYFKAMAVDLTATDAVRKSLLRRIGYDGEGFVKRGVLYDLWRNDADIRQIQAQAVKAIAAGQHWQSFYTSMRDFVTGTDEKQGVTEAEFRRVTQDIFAQNDRALTKHYADEIGLDKFIYQGGLMDNTREFCRLRNNRIFTRKEIEGWRNLEFQGKPAVYDPFLDCGGYNCRHTLDPISEELAEEFVSEGESVDQLGS